MQYLITKQFSHSYVFIDCKKTKVKPKYLFVIMMSKLFWAINGLTIAINSGIQWHFFDLTSSYCEILDSDFCPFWQITHFDVFENLITLKTVKKSFKKYVQTLSKFMNLLKFFSDYPFLIHRLVRLPSPMNDKKII